MEAVENLMVGEEAVLQFVVHESFMHRPADRSEVDFIATLGEDVFQTACLEVGVGEYEYPVPLGCEFREGLGDDVEVLVIEGLQGASVVDLDDPVIARTASGRTAGIFHYPHLPQCFGEGVG